MKTSLLALNHGLLFLCVSMYLGTGWSMTLFSFPIATQLTVDNYYLQFVPQIDAATRFFTVMTMVMIAACLIMLWSEWRTRLRWVPIVVLLMVLAATGLTTWKIFPLNAAMRGLITDPVVLRDTLSRWMALNWVRVAFWTVQWLSLMWFFGSMYRIAGAQGQRPS